MFLCAAHFRAIIAKQLPTFFSVSESAALTTENIELRESVMSKEKAKKEPQKSLKDKRREKKEKRSNSVSAL